METSFKTKNICILADENEPMYEMTGRNEHLLFAMDTKEALLKFITENINYQGFRIHYEFSAHDTESTVGFVFDLLVLSNFNKTQSRFKYPGKHFPHLVQLVAPPLCCVQISTHQASF